MDRAEYIEKLKIAYEGELYGEAWFGAMAERAPTVDTRRKFAAMARLEILTKATLAPLIAKLGIVGINESEQREKGRLLAQKTTELSWADFIAWFETEVAPFVEIYDELEAHAPAEEANVVAHLAQHERALLEFIRREAAGQSDTSIAPILSMLDSSSHYDAS